ncbi:MAG: GntR family transcriptional regulator [Porticoccaceae bacterium]|nr:GntR family transcriptional regulator [Porticoccaceae bacterium]
MPANHNFSKLARQPAYRAVSEKIRQVILSGELQAGDMLPTELELADQFGVTRSTLREAIRLLEDSGIIGRTDRKRLVVTLPQTATIGRSVSSAMLMHRVTFEELWQVAMGLEPLAGKLACASATADDKQRLAANLQLTATVLDDHKRLLEAEIEFHNLVASATHNYALLQARAPLNDLFYPAWGAVIRALSPGQRILVAHQKVFDAICNNQPKEAERWMEKHMIDFRRGIEMGNLGFHQPVTSAANSDPQN